MKRIAFEQRIYDYSTVEEAEKHMEKMLEKGWSALVQDDGNRIYGNYTDDLPYSVEYYK